MSNIIWPENLPQTPLVDGYSETAVDNVIRSQMDVGPAKARPRSTARIVEVSFSMLMTAEQLDILESFFHGDLMGGALEFQFPNPRGEGMKRARLTAPPSISGQPGIYEVDFEMEFLPQ